MSRIFVAPHAPKYAHSHRDDDGEQADRIRCVFALVGVPESNVSADQRHEYGERAEAEAGACHAGSILLRCFRQKFFQRPHVIRQSACHRWRCVLTERRITPTGIVPCNEQCRHR